MHQSDRVEIWQERLHRYSLSQMSVADFCRNQGVSQATFYKWKKKLQALPDPETESGRKDPQFLPLQFM
ncbi:IS66 family insertion sequence element accessory protein TnpA [Roseiconus lacunae]|uniref:IS66 family insertion sequence element accessory protein TnpA n=1 Tax=Roseiconus lacunae TaxID=2605694 RepID=UPI001E34D78C|nr:transposase [Roseiconus lacunae]MCD0457919.1 transposase [Roseiconus lacunae]